MFRVKWGFDIQQKRTMSYIKEDPLNQGCKIKFKKHKRSHSLERKFKITCCKTVEKVNFRKLFGVNIFPNALFINIYANTYTSHTLTVWVHFYELYT